VTHHDDPFPAVERASYDPRSGMTTFEWKSGAAWSIGAVRYDYTEAETYRTTDSAPARSSFLGVASHRVRPPGREFTLTTTIDVTSDSAAFHVTVTRELARPGQRTRVRRWRESLPREWH
jgi:hypothetical protein